MTRCDSSVEGCPSWSIDPSPLSEQVEMSPPCSVRFLVSLCRVGLPYGQGKTRTGQRKETRRDNRTVCVVSGPARPPSQTAVDLSALPFFVELSLCLLRNSRQAVRLLLYAEKLQALSRPSATTGSAATAPLPLSLSCAVSTRRVALTRRVPHFVSVPRWLS
jgi:hypothetical protein